MKFRHTFDDRKIIVVDSIAYKAINIDDYEFSPEKEANPDNELFIEKHGKEMNGSSIEEYAFINI